MARSQGKQRGQLRRAGRNGRDEADEVALYPIIQQGEGIEAELNNCKRTGYLISGRGFLIAQITRRARVTFPDGPVAGTTSTTEWYRLLAWASSA